MTYILHLTRLLTVTTSKSCIMSHYQASINSNSSKFLTSGISTTRMIGYIGPLLLQHLPISPLRLLLNLFFLIFRFCAVASAFERT